MLIAGLALSAGLAAQPSPAPAPTSTAVAEPALAPVPLSAATLAKLAKMKPLFDGKTLDGWVQAPRASHTFDRSDFTDLPSLVKKLTAKSDPISSYLYGQFDEAGIKALASFSPNAPAAEQRTAVDLVRRNLNRIVGAVPLDREGRFQSVQLRPETLDLQKKNPSGFDRMRLNRLLLEDAYPQEIAKSPSAAWIVKDGVMASTGAGRGSIYTREDYTHYRLVFHLRQITGNHQPGILIFCTRPDPSDSVAEAKAGVDALGGIQFQVPNGGHWDYRPGVNKAGDYFTRPVRTKYNNKEWAQVEVLVNAKTGVARMAVAQPVGTRAIENLVFNDPAAGKSGPIAWQMHNAGLFDEFKDVRIEIDPQEDRLITVE